MSYTYLEPEVAGSLGKDTQMDASIHPPLVKKLHYEFDGWLGDDILEAFPCFIVTAKLRTGIENNRLTGVSFLELKATTSDTFKELHPNKKLAPFYWMKINGQAGIEDFGLAKDYRLVVSAKAFALLTQFKINEADLEKFA